MKDITYPVIQSIEFGRITIDGETYTRDLYIHADGTIKKRKKKLARELYGTSHSVGPEELKKFRKRNPEILIIGSGHQGALELTKEGRKFLENARIDFEILPSSKAVRFYNASGKRKSLLIHLTC